MNIFIFVFIVVISNAKVLVCLSTMNILNLLGLCSLTNAL